MAHLRVREPQRRDAVRGVGLVAEPVSRLLSGRAVVAQPVGLDDQADLWPEEVHPMAVHPLAGARQRQSGTSDECEESALELRVGQAKRAAIEQLPQSTDPGLTQALESFTQPARVHEVQAVGLVHGPLEPRWFDHAGEIDQRSDR